MPALPGTRIMVMKDLPQLVMSLDPAPWYSGKFDLSHESISLSVGGFGVWW